MTGHKNGRFLEFTLDNGKVVKYDLATGESIGSSGKAVKSVAHHMKGFSIPEILNTIDDERYVRFLQWVRGYNTLLKNFGSLLVLASRYKDYEQYFSSGLTMLGEGVPCFQDCPPKLIQLAKTHEFRLTGALVTAYKGDPNLFNLAFSLDYLTMGKEDLVSLFSSIERLNNRYASWPQYMIECYGYAPKPFLLYLDRLMTLEALDMYDVKRNLQDTMRMFSNMSDKYDRYPRNLLTVHQIAIRNYKRLGLQYDTVAFKRQVDPSLSWQYKGYTVIVPQTPQDIKDEAVQQHNCVASYIRDVIDGRCQIVFLRYKAEPEKSLVTVEVRGNCVVQALQTYNQPLTKEQEDIIDHYEIYLNERKMQNAG